MSNLVSSGYTHTHSDIGNLPDSWSVRPLSEIVSVMTNGFVGTATSAYVESDDGVTYIQGFNVEPNGFNLTNIRKVSQDFHKSHTKSCLRTGDVLTIQTGEIGVSTVVPEHLSGSNCHALIISRFIKNLANPAYYCQYFNSKIGMNAFKEIETGTTMKHLNVGDMLQLLVPVPPLAEQQAIAEILLDMDTLISSLDQLIVKKRNIHQATMQQLLTGQRRLPGFSGGWEEASLGEISFISKGEQISQRGDAAGLIPHFNGGVYASSYTDTANTPEDTIAISEGGNSCGFVQFITTPFWCGGHCYAVRPRGVENLFLYFALKGKQDRIMGLRVGSGLPNIQKSALNSFQIALPSCRDEQTAIATILADMDSELAALEARRDKADQLKQGMMQELLTGKIRIK